MTMTKKTRIGYFFANALTVGALTVLSENAQSQTVYQNTSTFEQNFEIAGSTLGANGEAGNEVVLVGGAYFNKTALIGSLTSATVQFNLLNSSGGTTGTFTAGGAGIELNIYEENGGKYGTAGFVAPGTQLYSSGFTTMSTLGLTAFTAAQSITFTLPGTAVANDFTWSLAFNNVPTTAEAGISLFAGGGVGQNFNDAWVDTTPTFASTSSATWTLDQTTSGPGLQFGATLTGTVPEPSTIALGVMGASAFLMRLRRKQ